MNLCSSVDELPFDQIPIELVCNRTCANRVLLNVTTL